MGSKRKKLKKSFSLIEKFAQYGFNKSHSTAYAYVAYQTAWLKVHYPAEFMSANLTSEMRNIDRVVVLINECKKMGIEVKAPDLNISFEDFRPIDKQSISYGLNAIKNVGSKALETIIEERKENGIYKTIFDLCSRVDLQKVNKRVLESLIMSGSLDSIQGRRSEQFLSVDDAIKYGQQMQNQTNLNQVDLFGSSNAQNGLIKTPVLQPAHTWSEKESLKKEAEVLGLYVSGHPLLEHSDDLEEFTTISFEESQEISKNDTVTIGGMITRIVKRFDRRNRQMAFFEMDCLGGHAEIVVFSDCFASYGHLIEEESVVFIRGKLSETSDFSDLKIISSEIIPVGEVRNRLSQKININLSSSGSDAKDIDELMNICKSNKGNCKLIFHLPNEGSPRPLKILAHNITVSSSNNFLSLLRSKYGKDNVWIG